MKAKIAQASHAVVRVASHPVHLIAEVTHKATHIPKRKLRFIYGGGFMLTGSGMAIVFSHAHLPIHLHVLIDVAAYGIHGLGSVPFVVTLSRKMGLEPEEIEHVQKPKARKAKHHHHETETVAEAESV